MRYVVALLLATALFACEEEKRKSEIEGFKASEIVNNTATADESEPEQQTSKGGVPKFEFEKTEHAFGTIYEGEMVNHVFKFKNVGDAPLLIQNAQASCGCTVPSWPKKAIAPGESGEIPVEFNSKGKLGSQRKTITITANTEPNATRLVIAGEVLQSASADGPTNN